MRTMRPYLACAMLLGTVRAGAQGTLTGHVRESTGMGIASAEVSIAGGPLATATDGTGAFRIRNVPVGPVRVIVRRIGFRPVTSELAVTDGATADMTVALELLPVRLQQVTVTERRAAAADRRLAGFEERMQKRSGHFFTRDKIESMHPQVFTDILRGVPGLQLGRALGAATSRNARVRGSACWPLVFMDGVAAAAGEFDLDRIDPMTVDAVEVYSGEATAPTELMGPQGLTKCGVIVIWSSVERTAPQRSLPANPAALQAALQRMLETGELYSADAVDSAALMLPPSFAPVYPDSLFRRRVEGFVRVEFVVDIAGKLEWEYFSVVSASNPAFAEAVTSALEGASFVPALKGGSRVRQLFELPVKFEPSREPPQHDEGPES